MGKNLKGKECGKGICQRKDGKYAARFTGKTGLRTSELIGLTWDAIDWKKRTLTVNKTQEYLHKDSFWRAGPPAHLCHPGH